MPPLPRGRCACGAEAALRNGGLLRQHQPENGVAPRPELGAWCPGSGEKAADWPYTPPGPSIPLVTPPEPDDPDWQHDERGD